MASYSSKADKALKATLVLRAFNLGISTLNCASVPSFRVAGSYFLG